MSLVATLMVLVLTLAGCGGDDYVFPSEQSSGPAPSADLVSERKAAGIADCPATPTAVEPVSGGLPALTLGCLGGGESSTLSALRGTPMVINFWAQWCGPCRIEAPHLAAVSKATEGKVQFVGIDTNDSQPGLAIEFAREAGWTYPQLFDQDSLTKAPPLQVSGLPYTLLVDAQGRIVHRIPGEIASQQQLQQLITQHLGVSG